MPKEMICRVKLSIVIFKYKKYAKKESQGNEFYIFAWALRQATLFITTYATGHNELQRATTSHNDPQLRLKMNKTHKKLHSLVYAFSPLKDSLKDLDNFKNK